MQVLNKKLEAALVAYVRAKLALAAAKVEAERTASAVYEAVGIDDPIPEFSVVSVDGHLYMVNVDTAGYSSHTITKIDSVGSLTYR